MSTYVFGTSLSYRDYLQARSFTDSLKSEISSQTRLIIASDEELQRERIRITEKTIGAQSQVISTGLEQLSLQFQDLRAGISELNATFEWGFSELNATFEWGFSELLTTIGQVNDSLSTLIGIAKTPAQTWAYEQFDIARDAFRQRLYEEALEYLDRAINGYASNTGYKLEYRFHYLLGSIRLGSFTNNSPKIVNLIEAEKSFLNAARYARQDQPMEAGRANLAAGWGAYCQGKMDGAKEHTKSAISCYRNLPEAHFQLAKIHMHLNEPDTAVPCLKRAIELDRRYSIKAFSDGDFKRHEAKVRALLTDLRREERERAEKALIAVRRLAKEVEGQSNEDIVFRRMTRSLASLSTHWSRPQTPRDTTPTLGTMMRIGYARWHV